MHSEYLVKMANEIGAFFNGEAGPDAAPAQVARHIQRFWDKRMRLALIEHLNAGGAGLTPVALGAARVVANAQIKTAASAAPARS